MRVVAALALLTACARAAQPVSATSPVARPLTVAQLIVVTGTGGSAAQVALYENGELTYGPVPATVGRSGIIDAAQKREGDGYTPAGLYALPFAFGDAPAITTAMPYREATAETIWVDDPSAPDYNRWTTRSESHAKSFEVMRREDGQYALGLVIAYNLEPTTPGAGSAIFLHVWRAPDAPTSGCVALSKESVAALLARLDPEKKPMIVIAGPGASPSLH